MFQSAYFWVAILRMEEACYGRPLLGLMALYEVLQRVPLDQRKVDGKEDKMRIRMETVGGQNT